MFDRTKRYARIEGDSVAAYYQDGRYYRADGTEVSAEEASQPSRGGMFDDAVSREVEKRLAPTESQINESVKLNDPKNRQNRPKKAKAAKPAEDVNTAAAPENDAPTSNGAEKTNGNGHASDPRLAELNSYSIKELNQAVKKSGGEPFRGKLAKAQAIRYLLEHTAG